MANKDDSAVLQLTGRRNIYATSDEITKDNIISQLTQACVIHSVNLIAEDYLYWYRRGVTPILKRTKKRNKFINNKVNESAGIADQIVTFKDGYFMTQPATYMVRNDASQDDIDKLNEYLYRSGKHQADNKIVDWFHTVGKGVLYVEPNDDPDVPALAHALDPRGAFVVYSLRPGNAPLYGVNMVVAGESTYFDVYTRDWVYHLKGGQVGPLNTTVPFRQATPIELLGEPEPNRIGEVPIIEYRYNSTGMGAFELALSDLDALDRVLSNQVDGVEQFIQSLVVTYNCEFDEGVTAETIRDAGLVPLKSTADSKGDIKILSEQLDQEQTKVIVDHLKYQIFESCSMPLISQHGTTYDTTGAAVMANAGWYQADGAARNTEDLFKESNRQFDKIFTKILRQKGLLDLKPNDFELNFVRNETANVQAKAQAFSTMVQGGIAPVLAMAKSGISNDPVSDYLESKKWITMRWGDPDKPAPQPTETIIQRDSDNGENEMGGAV